MRIAVALISAACAILTACSSSSTHGTGTTSASAAPTPVTTAAAPSSDSAAALRQWGSLVSRLEGPVTKARNDFDASCGVTDYGPDAPLACSGGLLQIDLVVQIFDSSFIVGRRDLGDPPAELEQLVTSTAKDADAVHAAYAPVDKSCGQQQTVACDKARSDYLAAVDQLTSDFDGWKPYTS